MDESALKRVQDIYYSFFKTSKNGPLTTLPSGVSGDEVQLDVSQIIPNVTNNDPDKAKKAMEKAYKEWFKNGENDKFCARWVYNIAFRYWEAINNKPLTSYKSVKVSSGNAKDPAFRAILRNLGYQGQKVGSNISRNNLKNIINSVPIGIGDIIIYNSNELPEYSNEYTYGHAQIYVGVEIQTNDQINSVGWTSSKKDNYDTNFVYSNENKYKSNKWDIYVYRAPIQ